MATIRTAIELEDRFTGVLYQIINSVNLGLSAMEDLQQTMNSPVDTASLDGARDAANRAAIAVQQLDEVMQGMSSPAGSTDPVTVSIQPDAPDPLVEHPEPVEVPVNWKSDSMKVFTSTGIERFEQEIQSASDMLNTLSQTQSRIAAQAAQTGLFPDSAIADMDNMQNRLQAIQQRIQAIESNPLSIGSDTANAELEQLRGQLDRAVQEQEALNRAVESMDVEAANQDYLRLSQTIGNTDRYIRDNVNEQGRFNREIKQGTDNANSLMSSIKGVAATYFTVQTGKNILEASDSFMLTTSRLAMMNDGLQSTDDLVNAIYLSAQNARGSFGDMVAMVARFGTNAKDAFGSSMEAVKFAELIQKQMTIAGADTQEASNAVLQLSQALGSGVLRGDELNSIFEQAPNLIQSIADYLDVPVGKIRAMAQEGQLSADVVKAAVFASADDINAKFSEIPLTFGQLWQHFRNAALMAFQPVLKRLNEIANSEAIQIFATNAVYALSAVAEIIIDIGNAAGQVIGFIAKGWSVLEPIILGAAAALAVYYGWQFAANTISAIGKGIHSAIAAAQMIHAAATGTLTSVTAAQIAAQNGLNAALYACPIVWIIVLIVALVALFYMIINLINEITGTSISATGIIAGLIAMIGARLFNIVALIWNIVAAFIEFFVNVWKNPEYAIKAFAVNVAVAFLNFCSACVTGMQGAIGVLVGLWYGFVQVIKNVVGSIWNAISSVIEAVVNGWNTGVYQVKAFFINLASTVFSVAQSIAQSMGNAASVVANKFISAINFIISGINKLIDAINCVPGVSIGHVGKLSKVSWDFGASSIGTMAALQAGRGPEKWKAPAFKLGDVGNAYDRGKVIGADLVSGWEASLSGIVGTLEASVASRPDSYWEAPTLDYLNLSDAFAAGYKFNDRVGDKMKDFDPSSFLDTSIPNAGDYANLGDYANSGLGGIGRGVDDIARNTGAIADSMTVTEKELKYLRDIAERETINRFTTAEIKIEQTNHNNIRSELDLDGVVDGLVSGVSEAIDSITEGVHY